jgi:ribulose-5-phosphate 4-epimerase/fuculose-1-phosphate aldolase
MDEGYIKFQAYWQRAPALPVALLKDIIYWRDILHQQKLIGVYPNGIGYGNISQRWKEGNQFIISGSATGHLVNISAKDFTLVTKVDIAQNTVWCEGPIIASSETMSHAVIYETCPAVHAVIHLHHLKLWEKLLHHIPTTDASATYGSPEMAYSIIKLLQTTDLQKQEIFVMEGHPEGIFIFGERLEAPALKIIKLVGN